MTTLRKWLEYLEALYSVSEPSWRGYAAVVAAIHLILGWPKALWMIDTPAVWLTPPEGLGRLLPPFWPTATWLYATNAVAFIGLVGMLLGWRCRHMALLAFVSLVALDYWQTAIGHLRNTFYGYLAFVPIILAGRHKQLWRLGAAFCVGASMLYTARWKTMGGWLDLDTQAVLAHVTEAHFTPPFGVWLIENLPAAGWEVFDWATVGLEAGLLPCLFFPFLYRAVLVGLCMMHLGIFCIMGLPFWATLPFYAMFVDWDKIPGFRPQPRTRELTVLFDGHCNFCNEWVDFVSRRDPERRFAFRALQSEQGQATLAQAGMQSDYIDSLVLVAPENVWVKSDAALAVFAALGWPWSALVILKLVPRGIRDWAYDRIAAVRYHVFGRRTVCRMS